MDLQKLKDFSEKIRKNKNMLQELDLRSKEERDKINKEIDTLKKKLAKVDKKEKEELTRLKNASEIFSLFLDEVNEYGRYNICDLGMVLASLVTEVTGERNVFRVSKEDGFTEIIRKSSYMPDHKIGVCYSADVAYLDNLESKIVGNTLFVFAKSKAPDASTVTGGKVKNGCIRGINTNFSNDCDLVMRYDPDDEQFHLLTADKNDFLKEKKIYPFICDFLNYVSMYRLNNDLKNINCDQLTELAAKFVIENEIKENNLPRRK